MLFLEVGMLVRVVEVVVKVLVAMVERRGLPQDAFFLGTFSLLPPLHCPFSSLDLSLSRSLQAVARMVIWTTRKKGLYDDANFSHRDLVLYFRHQLRVKISCDRKRLDRITFSKRWVNAASLVVRKGAMLESSFPPLPTHGVYGTGPSGPQPEQVAISFCPP